MDESLVLVPRCLPLGLDELAAVLLEEAVPAFPGGSVTVVFQGFEPGHRGGVPIGIKKQIFENEGADIANSHLRPVVIDRLFRGPRVGNLRNQDWSIVFDEQYSGSCNRPLARHIPSSSSKFHSGKAFTSAAGARAGGFAHQ